MRGASDELGEGFESHSDTQRRLFDWFEVFYNGTHRHWAIGYCSPRAFERLTARRTVNPQPERPCPQTDDPIHKL